jgi:hypothetical protein
VFPRRFVVSILGAEGNLAGGERYGWMMSGRVLKCLGFEAGGGGPWTRKMGEICRRGWDPPWTVSTRGLIDFDTSRPYVTT